MNKTSKRILAVGLPLAGVAVTGAALAYWSGSGSTTSSAATSAGGTTFTVAQTSTFADLAPGVAAQTIAGTVKNDSTTENAHVTAVTASITSVTPAGAGTCDATDYTLASPAMAVGQDLAPGATVTFSGATLMFNNKATNQDGCKGATVNLSYVVS